MPSDGKSLSEESHPSAAPYVPFPSFDEFARGGFDHVVYDSFAAVLAEAKAAAGEERMREAVATATRWAAVDTGAIEGLYAVDRGFTYSVAAEAAAWDNLHKAIGELAGNLIRDALTAYEQVLDVATNSRPPTEAWIREIHEVICASQESYIVLTELGPQSQPLEKGRYKVHPNNPLNIASGLIHEYASVADTPAEMGRLVSELNGASFCSAHPVLQAAFAHYAFVCVHPFADGNGRVARALASTYLYRSPGVPLVIFADQKGDYLDSLEAADAGDFQPFVGFIGDRAVDVVRMVARDMARKPLPALSDRMAAMRAALLGRGGLTHSEVDALAELLIAEFAKSLDRAAKLNPVEPPLTVQLTRSKGNINPSVTGFRTSPGRTTAGVQAISASPATGSAARWFGVLIARGASTGPDFLLVDGGSQVIEEVVVRELSPTVNPALTYRLDISAEEAFLAVIDETVASAQAHLRKTGYIDQDRSN